MEFREIEALTEDLVAGGEKLLTAILLLDQTWSEVPVRIMKDAERRHQTYHLWVLALGVEDQEVHHKIEAYEEYAGAIMTRASQSVWN